MRWFPAISVALTVKELTPATKETLVKVNLPVLSAITVVSVAAKDTVTPGSVKPVSVTVSNLVFLSPTVPESDAASKLKTG